MEKIVTYRWMMKWEKIATHRMRIDREIYIHFNIRSLYKENTIMMVILTVTIVHHDGSHLLLILHLHNLLNSKNYG